MIWLVDTLTSWWFNQLMIHGFKPHKKKLQLSFWLLFLSFSQQRKIFSGKRMSSMEVNFIVWIHSTDYCKWSSHDFFHDFVCFVNEFVRLWVMCEMNKKKSFLVHAPNFKLPAFAPHTPFLQVNVVLISNWIYHIHKWTHTNVVFLWKFLELILYKSAALRLDNVARGRLSCFLLRHNSVHFLATQTTAINMCIFLHSLLHSFLPSASRFLYLLLLPLLVAGTRFHIPSFSLPSSFLLKKRNFRHASNHMRHMWL